MSEAGDHAKIGRKHGIMLRTVESSKSCQNMLEAGDHAQTGRKHTKIGGEQGCMLNWSETGDHDKIGWKQGIMLEPVGRRGSC